MPSLFNLIHLLLSFASKLNLFPGVGGKESYIVSSVGEEELLCHITHF
jgi:hypothetical protein